MTWCFAVPSPDDLADRPEPPATDNAAVTGFLSRRDFLQLVAATAVLPASPAGAASRRRSVGIVGGGMAGVSLAWLLDGAYDVTLLEARDSIGGNIRSVDVVLDGHEFVVDMGAQYFHPGPVPALHHVAPAARPVRPERRGAERGARLPRLDHADRRRERDAALRLAGPARPLVAVPRAVELGGSLGLRRRVPGREGARGSGTRAGTSRWSSGSRRWGFRRSSGKGCCCRGPRRCSPATSSNAEDCRLAPRWSSPRKRCLPTRSIRCRTTCSNQA